MKTLIRLFSTFAIVALVAGCTDRSKIDAAEVKSTDPVVQPVAHNHMIHAMSGAGCAKDSWSPEIYTLYGDSEIINQKLENSEMDLVNRRLYLYSVETDEGSMIRLFERGSDGNMSVSEWIGTSGGNFVQEVSQNILSNKGVACVGEQTQAILKKLNPKDIGSIPAPVSAQAAFSHGIKNFAGKYLKVTVFLMC